MSRQQVVPPEQFKVEVVLCDNEQPLDMFWHDGEAHFIVPFEPENRTPRRFKIQISHVRYTHLKATLTMNGIQSGYYHRGSPRITINSLSDDFLAFAPSILDDDAQVNVSSVDKLGTFSLAMSVYFPHTARQVFHSPGPARSAQRPLASSVKLPEQNKKHLKNQLVVVSGGSVPRGPPSMSSTSYDSEFLCDIKCRYGSAMSYQARQVLPDYLRHLALLTPSQRDALAKVPEQATKRARKASPPPHVPSEPPVDQFAVGDDGVIDLT